MAQNNENDFSGGITDYYLDPLPNKHAKMDNWLITGDNTATVRPGSRLYDTAHPRAEAGRIGKVFEFGSKIFKIIKTKLFRYETSGWVHLSGIVPANNVAFPGAIANSTDQTNFSIVQQNNHFLMTSTAQVGMPRKAYLDNGGTWRIFTAGLPALTFANSYPTFTPAIAGVSDYIYFFCHTRTYQVSGGVTFKDFGPVVQYPVNTANNMNGVGATITIVPNVGNVWPHVADSANEFYDQVNNKISIYRTTTQGTVGYFVGEVAVGSVAAFVDDKSDSELGESLYINGDVLDWDQPPICKFLTQCQDIIWFANVIEVENGAPIKRPYRIRQGIQFGLDKAPVSFFVDVDGDITGMSSIGDFPIVFTERKCWRLEGFVDTQGNGFTRKILLSDTVGCIENDSIIQSQRGLAFAALDGFYFSDGYNVMLISESLALSYSKLLADVYNLVPALTVTKTLRRKRISGSYDRSNDCYYWSIHTDTEKVDNDSHLIFDASMGINANASFTSASSGADYMPSACVFVGDDMIRGDNRGYLLLQKEDYFDDVMIESRPAATDWINKAIPYDYISSARSMGDSTITKWAGVLQTTFVNLSDISIQPQTTDDDQKDWRLLKEMRFRGNYIWGQKNMVWGTASDIWNYRAFIFFERRFPHGSLRFTYKQIRFTPSYTVILASFDTDQAILDPIANTVTITGLISQFETDHVGYYLHFEYDNYLLAYEIITWNSATQVVIDPSPGGFAIGTYRWEIRGYRKGERPALRNHITLYEPFGDSQHGFRRTDGGGNG